MISPPLKATFSDASKAFFEREDGETFLSLTLTEGETWTLESPATGPGTLAISHQLRPAHATLRIGDEEYFLGDYHRSSSYFYVPEGEHTVTLSFQPRYGHFFGKLYSISLSSSPLARVRANADSQLGQYGNPLAEFTGIEPLTVTWFRDGVVHSRLENAKSGQSILFARPINGHDHGTYHIEVTDAQGSTAQSDPFFIDVSHRAGEVLDYPDWLRLSAYRMKLDREVKVKGDASLLFYYPFYRSASHYIELVASVNYAKLWIRSAGFPPDSEIQYFSEGKYKSIPANGDWTAITVEARDENLRLLLPEASENSKVWIDHLTPVRKAKFVQQPSNVATYLGASIHLEARAHEHSVGDLKALWTKDGQPIASEHPSQLAFDSVSFDDLGAYHASVVSPNGQIVESRTATLSLVSTELAAAIGYPGARITTIGNAPWKVDYADSVDGASSIVSGTLGPNESTAIEIEIDGPVSWGLYSYSFDEYNSNYGHWNYVHATPAPANGSSQLIFSTASDARRIDGVRLTRLSDHSYEQWIEQKLTAQPFPTAENRNLRTSDPDNDGLPNWLEFALNLDPAIRNDLPALGVVPSEIGTPSASVQFYAARSNEYSIGYEASFDLENWFIVKPSIAVVNSISGYDHIKATFNLEEANQRPYFVRWGIHRRTEAKGGAF